MEASTNHRLSRGGVYRCVVVSGFICTGSSALIDALRGNSAIAAFLPEFKILGGQDGLFEVVEAFERDRVQGVATFRRFAKRIVEEGRHPNRAYHYRQRVMRKVAGDSYTPPYRRRSYSHVIAEYPSITRTYLRGLGRLLSAAVKPEEIRSSIEEATNDYFRSLCECIGEKERASWVIFNQSIKPGSQTGLGLELIKAARVIAVDRDPRDQYIDLLNQNRLVPIIQKYGTPTGDLAGDFARWYRRRRQTFYETHAGDERVLVVRFEDLATDPSAVLQEVSDFLGLEGEIAVGSGPFDQEVAQGKVGMWREFSDRGAIARIEKELTEYCATV